MPSYRSRQYAIQAGTQTVGSFDSTHIIENFTLQTDQGFVGWFAPAFFQSAVPERPIVNRALDMTETEDGFYTFQWVFSYFTNDMLEHWVDTYLNSGDPTGNVTVRTYDTYDNAVYLTCKIVKPRQSKTNLVPAAGGWLNVTFEFIGGAIIT